MNKIVNKFSLAGDKFMPEKQLKQSGFTCRSFTKNRERIQELEETGDTKYIYRNEMDKCCFYSMVQVIEIIEVQEKRTSSDKVLRDKAFNIAKNPKYD